jgi:hypothetical protein
MAAESKLTSSPIGGLLPTSLIAESHWRRTCHGGRRQNADQDLGTMELRDDADACSFGDGVIRDMMSTEAGFYIGWTLDIFEEECALPSVPFVIAN